METKLRLEKLIKQYERARSGWKEREEEVLKNQVKRVEPEYGLCKNNKKKLNYLVEK